MKQNQLTLGVLLIVAAVVPLALGEYQAFLVSQTLLFALAVMALDITWGYGGILNLGHAIFFGGGAYLFAYVTVETPLGAGVGLVLAVGVPMAIASVVGYLLFTSNLDEGYFGVFMLGAAAIVEQIVGTIEAVGGHSGLTGIPAIGIPGVPLYYLVLVLVVSTYLLVKAVLDRPFGFRLRALRMNEERTRFLGYNTIAYKSTAFALSAAIAGLAGAFYASLNGFVSPSLIGLVLSVEMLIWLIIGGFGTLVGAFVGTFFIKYTQFYVGDVFSDLWLLFLGVLFVVVVLAAPGGLYPITRRRLRRWRS